MIGLKLQKELAEPLKRCPGCGEVFYDTYGYDDAVCEVCEEK